MTIHNSDLATAFAEIADLLEIKGENAFRVRAYRGASRSVDNLGREIASFIEKGEDLTALPGIGKDLAAKIEEMVTTGHIQALEKLKSEIPSDVRRMLKLPGLGPKRVKALYQDLGITTLVELEKQAREGSISKLPGMGKKLEEQIIKGIATQAEASTRFLKASVVSHVDELISLLSDLPVVERVEVAGSFRRARESIGDVDILAVAESSDDVMKTFISYDHVEEVLVSGSTKTSVVLRSGLQVDLRVVERESFGAAWHYFTGSKEHNVELRRRAQQQGLKVNEYGVFKGEERVAGESETELFEILGLTFIEPELRENRGEFEAAEKNQLPDLVQTKDIRGDLHMHTTASDGRHSIQDMAEAAKDMGYEYIAITEHSKRLTIAHGLDESRLREQIVEIDALNAADPSFRIFKGMEVDILEDGSLDLEDELLQELDVVMGSVHNKFNLSREKQTERILRALDHPCLTCMGHPSGRLILEREPYEVDMEKVILHAAQRGCFLEVNANPHRLDLTDIHARMACEAGVKLCIDTDAHRVQDLALMKYGIGQARRGWVQNKDVVNTRSLDDVEKLLRKTRR